MRGQIYSEQKCPKCGGQLQHDKNREGLFCPEHPEQQANCNFIVRFGRGLSKRFNAYLDAERFLSGVRYEVDTGKFDIRDYQHGSPLGFETLATRWRDKVEKEVRPGTFKGYRRYIKLAIEFWGQRNIKTIGYAAIEDFFESLDLSDKSKYNIRSCLSSFFKWVELREEGRFAAPKIPIINYELGWRTIIAKKTQAKIIDEVKRLTYHRNPKIWIAIKWLATYVCIRPGELIQIQERDVDVDGKLIVRHKKEKEIRFVDLVQEDKEIVKSLPRGLPDMAFFMLIGME